MPPTPALRNFCATINNYNDTDLQNIEDLKPFLDYGIVGREVSETETPHLQCYFELHKQKRFSAVSKILPRAHIEPRKGTSQQASDYCRKYDSSPDVYGELSTPGARSDLDSLASRIQAGATRTELAADCPTSVLKYSRGIEALMSYSSVPRDRSTPKTVRVFYGFDTGAGKTRTAFDLMGDTAYIWGPEQDKWFCGYDNHKHVILDEFRGQLPYGFLLRLLDRYPMRVQVKGGSREFVADEIIITSPKHPTAWYSDLPDDRINQLLRRITEIRHFQNSVTQVPATITRHLCDTPL